jgi:hypothetical protein
MFQLDVDKFADLVCAVEFESAKLGKDFSVRLIYEKPRGAWTFLEVWSEKGDSADVYESNDAAGANAERQIDLLELFETINFVRAEIFKGWKNKRVYDTYETWEALGDRLGFRDLTTVSAKLPKVVAMKFAKYAERHGQTTSSQIKKLILEWLEEELKENAKMLIFQE